MAASYSRYSSDLQSEDSIATQRQKCRERAAQNGHQLPPELEFADEAVSGTKLRREGLDALLAAAAEGRFQVLYFFSLSRLAREQVIAMPTLKTLVHIHKVRVISISEGVDSSQDGWDVLATILSVQHERFIKDLAANTFRGQEGALLAGFSVGDYCFGFCGVPIPGTERGRGRGAKPRVAYANDTDAAAWVVRIFFWFVTERRSLRWIAKELSRRGAPKDHRATTNDWHHQQVARLLGNVKYRGVFPWGRRKNDRNPLTGQVKQEERPEDEWKKWTRHFPELQIIDDETFAKAEERLKANRERLARSRDREGKLRGFLITRSPIDACGARMRWSTAGQPASCDRRRVLHQLAS